MSESKKETKAQGRQKNRRHKQRPAKQQEKKQGGTETKAEQDYIYAWRAN